MMMMVRMMVIEREAEIVEKGVQNAVRQHYETKERKRRRRKKKKVKEKRKRRVMKRRKMLL